MPMYQVEISVTTHYSMMIEAEDEEAATDKAHELFTEDGYDAQGSDTEYSAFEIVDTK